MTDMIDLVSNKGEKHIHEFAKQTIVIRGITCE